MELDGRERAVLADLVMWEGAGRGLCPPPADILKSLGMWHTEWMWWCVDISFLN